MNVTINPSRLEGTLSIPPSKSISHRALICAGLADGESQIVDLLDCEDTRATIRCLTQLGATITQTGNITTVTGIKELPETAQMDCHESGSTLRFLIPIAAALGVDAAFIGRGLLPQRPITPYFTQLTEHGILFKSKTMPYEITGKLTGGTFLLSGDVSSQFITGLLFALPILNEDSIIQLSSPLQSKPYVDLTIAAQKEFCVEIQEIENGYFIKGNQSYRPAKTTIQPDFSQAAFFLVANAIGSNVTLKNLPETTLQGDGIIVDIVKEFQQNGGKAFTVDATDIPDLVPILSVLATFAKGESIIKNCARLRIKECDRLEAVRSELTKLGGKIRVINDDLYISGVEKLNGGMVLGYNDHRIVMALSIAALRATAPVIISDAQAIRKSYPTFFKDYRQMGGKTDGVEF
jgi:3-phosphoshikimate 1-carboxyvinyltransferase